MGKKKEIVIPLEEPIEFGSETIKELVLKRPKGKHLRKVPMEPDFGDMLDLAGEMCEQPPSVIDELDVVDVMRVADELGKFMPSGQGTGGKRSG